MIKRLTRNGNSYGIVIERALLDQMGINPERDPVDVQFDGRAILIRSLPRDERRSVDSALAEVNKKAGAMLARLAR